LTDNRHCHKNKRLNNSPIAQSAERVAVNH
jgi:hypothetical protein